MRSGGRTLAAIASVVAVAAVAFWQLTRPDPLPADAIPTHAVDLRNGETLYHAGSCLACHKAPEGAPGSDRGLPAGGTPFPTPVGTFHPQNLTPDVETGIGRWSEVDFVNAMRLGISPRGTHYFPAFPYASYRSMTMADLLDLRAYLMSLPAVRSPSPEAERADGRPRAPGCRPLEEGRLPPTDLRARAGSHPLLDAGRLPRERARATAASATRRRTS